MAKGRLEARITVPTGGWAVSASENAGARSSTAITVAAAAAEYYLSSPGTVADTDMLKALENALNNDATLTNVYTVALSTTTGKVTISATGDNFAITWDSTDLRDLLGWDGNITETGKTYTSDNHAESLWLPDGDWVTDYGDVAGWVESDKHDVESASGYGWSYQGSKRYVNSIFWPAVGRAKTLAGKETTENESFEAFWRDGILGEQNWATTGGPIRWYPDTSAVDDATYFTYRCHGLETFRPDAVQENWVGQYSITLPRLVQDPGEYPAVGDSVLASGTPASVSALLAASDPAQELIDIMGHGTKPTYMWDCTVASGATDLIGSNNLTDVSSPTKQVTDSALGVDCTGMTFNSAESMDAASSTVADLGNESIAVLWVGRLTGSNSGNYGLCMKRDSGAPNAGWALRTGATNQLAFIVDQGASIVSLTIAVNHGTTNAQCALGLMDQNANLSGVYSREGSDTSTAISAASAANALSFAIGQNALRNAAAANHAFVAVWIGTAAEGITGTMRSTLATQLGLE